jgi:hypothetical protein
MKNMKILIALFWIIFTSSTLAYADVKPSQHPIIWTAVFSHVMPNKSNITMDYCQSHTPTVMVTTISQITSKTGVQALNGIWVKYLSYKTIEKDGLFFNLVNAVISGKDKDGKPWSTPMKLYEQTLTPVGVTYTVWSTPDCKGTFLGTPTALK